MDAGGELITKSARIAVLCAAALWTATAPAQDAAPREAIRWTYDAPAGCADEATFAQKLLAKTDRAYRAAGDEPATVFDITISIAGTGFAGRIDMTDKQGARSTRKIEGPSCNEVMDAVALVCAVVVDPTAGMTSKPPQPTQPAETQPQPEPPQPEPPAPTQPAPTQPAPTQPAPTQPAPTQPAPTAPAAPAIAAPPPPPTDDGWDFRLGLQGVVTGLLTSDALFGGQLFVELSQRPAHRVAFDIRLSAQLSSAGEVVVRDGGGSFSFYTGRAELCPLRALASDELRLPLCLLGELGAVDAEGRDVEAPRQALRGWFSPGIAARFQWLLHESVMLELEGSSAFPVTRHSYRFEPDSPLYTIPIVFVRGGAGLAARF